MNAELLYSSPCTELAPMEPNGLFEAGQVEALITALE
jgi:hypothetical protein